MLGGEGGKPLRRYLSFLSCRALGWLETWGDTRGLQLCVMGRAGSGRLMLDQRPEKGHWPFHQRSGLCEGQVRSSLAHRGRKQVVGPLCQELGTQESLVRQG